MVLPLPEVKEIELLDNDEEIIHWIDNETLQMKGFKENTNVNITIKAG